MDDTKKFSKSNRQKRTANGRVSVSADADTQFCATDRSSRMSDGVPGVRARRRIDAFQR